MPIDWNAVASSSSSSSSPKSKAGGGIDWDAVAGAPPTPKDKPYARRGKESYQALEGDLPFGLTSEDLTHPDVKRIAAHAITSLAKTAAQPGGVMQAIAPQNIAAKAGGNVINYATSAPVGGTIEHMVPNVNLPGWLQSAISLVPGGKQWAADPRSVARAAGDVGAMLAAPPAEAGESAVAKLLPRLKGPAAEKAATDIAAFERVGAKPTAAAIVPKARGVGIHVGQNPFIGGPIRGAIHQTEKAVQRKAEEFRQGTPERAGERVSQGLQKFQQTSPETAAGLRSPKSGFKVPGAAEEGESSELTRGATISSLKRTPVRHVGFGPKSTALYTDAEEKIGPLTHPITASKTRAALGAVSKAFDNPALNQLFGESTVKDLRSILASSQGRLSFEDLRRLRTSFRTSMQKALSDPSTRADFNAADMRKIYNAMTEDLQSGAEGLGKLWGGAERGAAAGKSWKRADAYYRAGMDRIDDALSKHYGAGTDSATVFHRLMKAAQGGSKQDLKELLQVRRSLSPEDWQAFSSTIVDQMGRAAPGQASAEAEFSLNTFLTNYNRFVEPAARETSGVDSGFKVLFEGNYGREAAGVVKDMQTVASHYRELMRGKNISMTAPHLLAGALPVTAAVIAHNPLLSVVTLGSGYGVSRLLSNPKFVKWLARVPTKGTPEETAGVTRQMKAWLATVGAGTSVGQQRLGQAQQAVEGQ